MPSRSVIAKRARSFSKLRVGGGSGDGGGEGETPQRLRFSQRFECKNDGSRYEEPEPRLFSFNNPYGACPRCQGFGNTIDIDLDLVIPDKSKTLNEGAIEPWTKPKYRPLFTELKRFARQAEIPLDVPWYELDAEQQRLIVEGECARVWRRPWLLPASRAQEVQAARPRFSQSLSRILALLCLRRHSPARGSAPGKNRRQEYLPGVQYDG